MVDPRPAGPRVG